MLSLGLGLGGLLLAIGLITYYLAPRVGPNPIFGVRVGYSYASREVWDKSNRAGGIFFCFAGLGIMLGSLILSLFNIPAQEGMRWLTVALIVVSLVGAVWMFWYARRLAAGTQIAAELKPVPFRWAFVVPASLAFVVLVLLAVYLYPSLPVERMASHFDLTNRPDGWMPRDAFMVNYLGTAALILLLNLAIVLLATREPLVAFGRWGANWRLDPEQGLLYVGIMFALVLFFLAGILWDVASFNVNGSHVVPLTVLFGVIGLIVVVATVLFFALARRTIAQ